MIGLGAECGEYSNMFKYFRIQQRYSDTCSVVSSCPGISIPTIGHSVGGCHFDNNNKDNNNRGNNNEDNDNEDNNNNKKLKQRQQYCSNISR